MCYLPVLEVASSLPIFVDSWAACHGFCLFVDRSLSLFSLFDQSFESPSLQFFGIFAFFLALESLVLDCMSLELLSLVPRFVLSLVVLAPSSLGPIYCGIELFSWY